MARSPRAFALILCAVGLLAGGPACRSRQSAKQSGKQSAPSWAPPTARPEARQPAPRDPAAEEEQAATAKALAALACLDRDLRQRRQQPPFAGYQRSSFTDIFVFHRLFDEPKQLDRPADELCGDIAAAYRTAFLATVAGRRGSAPAQTVDAEPAFVRSTGSGLALHLLAHAELTGAVLREVNGGRPRPVFDTVSYAAQQSDIYRWQDLRYHAHTEPHAPSARAAESGNSQEAFVGLLAATIGDFKEQLAQGSMSNAAIHLGVACHMAQDLVLHQGITRRQLAGLQFFAGRPPLLDGPAAQHEAKRLTRAVIALARQALGNEAAWRRLLAWAPPPGFDYRRAFGVVFSEPDRKNLQLPDLVRHWASQRGYQHIPAARAELGDGPQGLIRWDVDATMTRVRTTLENGGIVVASPGAGAVRSPL